MAEPPTHPDSREHEGAVTGGTSGMPRWVKVFAIIGAALVAAMVVAVLAGGGPGGHGPGRHMGGGQPAEVGPSVSAGGAVGDHRAPAGGHQP